MSHLEPGPRSSGDTNDEHDRVHRSQWSFPVEEWSRVPDTFVQDGPDSGQVWYTIDDSGACVVLTVGGRVDADTCPGVCDAVLVASGFSSRLVVDLSRAEFADAAAAGLFVRSLQQSRSAAYSARVVGPPEPVGWLLGVSETGADIAVSASVEEAVGLHSRPTHGLLPP